MKPDDIVIVAAKRTPMGGLLGQLSTLRAPDLAAYAHLGAMTEANMSPNDIDEVITGCVLQAGIGQAPARQAAMKANIAEKTPASTLNKMCGSGMKAVMLAHDLIKAGSAEIVLAGGMESMSNAPYLLSKARAGYRLGHGALLDSMFLDGLEDAYEPGTLMGYYADVTAKEYHFSREQQDAYAIESTTRAMKAQESGAFREEIVPLTVALKKGDAVITQDEIPDATKIAKIPTLKPAFQKDGTVTAANSSSISDGAASLILMTHANAVKRGIKPLAKIVAHASHAQSPAWFTTAPVQAIKRVLDKAGWAADKVDLYEINEAFAVVTMAAIKDLHLDPNQVNVHGGACALGHPIGASGARILVTLIHALKRYKKQFGVASLCIGGGEAVAIALEVFHA